MSLSKRILVLILVILGVWIALVLELRSSGHHIGEGICKAKEIFNCEAVTSSKWSQIFGVKLSTLGLFYYLFLFFICFCSFFGRLFFVDKLKNVLSLFVLISSVLSLYYFIISKFVIGALCPFCIMLYVLSLVLLVVVFYGNSVSDFIKSVKDGLRFLITLPVKFFNKNSFKENGFSLITIILSLVAACSLTITLPPMLYVKKEIPVELSQFQKHQRLDKFTEISEGLERDFSIGPEDAPIQLVEFSDIECPYCRRMFFAIDELLEKFEGKIHFVYKNYPLDSKCNDGIPAGGHEYACYAAELARCAGEQDMFWDVLEYLFSEDFPRNIKVEEGQKLIINSIIELGLDREKINSCLSSKRQLQKIKQDIIEGDALELMATPTIWVNGSKVKNPTIESLNKIFKFLLE